MGIPTAESLRRVHRRLARRTATKHQHGLTAASILQKMQRGASLRCHHSHRTIWTFSTGEFVAHVVAIVVVGDPRVVAVGDCLFGGELSQTYRFTESN
jgi:hypothetical protein